MVKRDGKNTAGKHAHAEPRTKLAALDAADVVQSAEQNGASVSLASRDATNGPLSASDERYRLMFWSAPVAMYRCDANGVIHEFNQRAVELWGREPRAGDPNERYCGSFKIFAPDGTFMPHDRSPIARVLRGETVTERDAEILVERPDGRRRNVICYPQAMKNVRGDTVGAINYLYDITERKRADIASDLHDAIVTSAEDAIASKTLDGIITSWNARAERMFGYAAAEIVGQSVLLLIPPERRDEEDLILARIRAGQRIEHFETTRVMKDGRPIEVSLTISPVRDGAGNIVGASKIIRDITERRQTERLLAEQNHLLELTAAGRPLDECLTELTRAVERLQPRTRASVLLADDARASIASILAAGIPPSFGQGLLGAPIGELAIGTCGLAISSGEPVACADIAKDERWSPAWRELCVAHGVLACHSEPVMGSDSVPLASLLLCFDTPREPTAWELRVAEFGAHLATIAIQRARAEAALRESKATVAAELAGMRQLQRLSSQLIHEGDLDALYEQIVDAAMAVMRSDMGSMQIFVPDKNGLRLLAWKGFAPAAAAFWEWVSLESGSTCGEALRTGQRVIVPDIEAGDFLAGTEDLDYYRLSGIVAVQSTPLMSRGGRLVGMISTHWRTAHEPSERDGRLFDMLARQAADLIERTQAEEGLRTRAAEFRTIANAAPALVWVCDNDGQNIYFNDRWYAFTGQTQAEASGSGWTAAMHPDDAARILPQWERCQQTGATYEGEVRYRRFDGVYCWYTFRALPRRDANGRIAAWYGASFDISERREAEEALRASERALQKSDQLKDEFLGIASHELRTPLTSAKANVQIVARRLARLLDAPEPDPTDLLEQVQSLQYLLDRSESALDRLARLVADLLDISRIQAGKLEMRPQRVDLAVLVREAVEEEEQSWPGREIRLEGPALRPARGGGDAGEGDAGDGSGIWMEVDPDRVRQVVLNYLTNALKYAPPDRPIHVRMEARGDEVFVAVRDAGPGLIPEQQAHLFERFYRVVGIDHQQGAGIGLGLGLHICKTIVERHGGTVGVESAPGQGSTFWFTLPLGG